MNKKYMPWLRDLKVRAAFLVATFVVLSLLFLSPSIRLTDKLQEYAKSEGRNSLDRSTMQYLEVENQKVIEEIKLRTEAQDSWFHYKFILTGGMVALLLGQIGLGHFGSDRKEQPAGGKSRRWVKDFFSSEAAYLILALSCVVGFIIDMHLRSQHYANQRLGLWLAYYVEPSFVTAKDMGLGFRPWEQLLRASDSAYLDNLYRLFYSLHLHYMTVFIYLLYSLLLQGVCLGFEHNEKNEGQRLAVMAGFIFVLLSAFAFTLVAHTIPGIFVMHLIPFEMYENGLWSMLYYLIPVPFLVALHLPYLLLVRNSRRAAAPQT